MKRTGMIVTGVSSGLGLALAHEALKQGACVFGVSRSTPFEIEASARFQWQQADLSQTGNAKKLIEDALRFLLGQKSQKIILINNAGSANPMALCGHYPDEVIVRSIALNITAPILLANAFIAQLPEYIAGTVLSISSGAGRTAYPGWGVYGATKAAVDHFARVLATEQKTVKSVALAPGVVDTNMQKKIRNTRSEDFPMVARFTQMKKASELSAPEVVAQKIIDYLNTPSFGEEAVVDIRTLNEQ